MHKLVHLNIK